MSKDPFDQTTDKEMYAFVMSLLTAPNVRGEIESIVQEHPYWMDAEVVRGGPEGDDEGARGIDICITVPRFSEAGEPIRFTVFGAIWPDGETGERYCSRLIERTLFLFRRVRAMFVEPARYGDGTLMREDKTHGLDLKAMCGQQAYSLVAKSRGETL